MHSNETGTTGDSRFQIPFIPCMWFCWIDMDKLDTDSNIHGSRQCEDILSYTKAIPFLIVCSWTVVNHVFYILVLYFRSLSRTKLTSLLMITPYPKGTLGPRVRKKQVLLAPEEGDKFVAGLVKAVQSQTTDRSVYNNLLDGATSTTLCANLKEKH